MSNARNLANFKPSASGQAETADIADAAVTQDKLSSGASASNLGTYVTTVNGLSGAVTVQDTLVSGTNIKSINSTSLLGSGNLVIDPLPSQAGNEGKYLTTNGTSASWVVIPDQPIISGVSPTVFNGEAGTEFTISGFNFSSGAVVSFIGNDGTVYPAAITSFVSSLELTATTPEDLLIDNEPYGVKVTLTTGANTTASGVIDAGGAPTWVTASGSIGSVYENSAVSTSVSATDPEGGSVTYTITSGALPSGVTLNSSTGAITGTSPSVANDTTYSFTVTAADSVGNSTPRAFSLTVLDEVAPQIASVSTSAATTGSTVTVSGTNFIPTTFVKVGSVSQTTTYVNSTTLTFVVNASTSTTTQNVTTENPSGLNSSISSAFRRASTPTEVKNASTFYTTSSNYDNYTRATMTPFGNIGGGSGVIAVIPQTAASNVTYTVNIGYATFTDDGATYQVYVNGVADVTFVNIGGNSSTSGTYTYTKSLAPGSTYTISVYNRVTGTCCGGDYVRVNSVQSHNIT